MDSQISDTHKKRVPARLIPSKAHEFFQALLTPADVTLNGSRPWDMRVRDERVFSRILTEGSLGLGESYVDGWWEAEQLDAFFTRVLHARLDEAVVQMGRVKLLSRWLHAHLANRQSVRRAYQVGKAHYDIGNDLYERMLDPTMSYSCGYWRNARDLTQAQYDKLDLICRKLNLAPGHHLLDIGCGWGGLARFAARHYGVRVTGITISEEQQRLAQERCRGLPVEIVLQDYRALEGRFDRIVSVGMFEHVGRKNYRTYFETVARLLADDGLFLLHCIGTDNPMSSTDGFIERYIFPNGEIPGRYDINAASLDLLRLEDWHNFGPDYDHTLMAWWQRFDSAWPELKGAYSDRFYRMWKYYLLSCAGYFRSRQGQLWQLVYSQPRSLQSYTSLR